ncbi:metalloregulator ArsR/SmtB family transcription factor [Acidiferrobacter sp.]|uniref:metalloregulator ArsR/SmtB family transcription factor n=1 Tax=Acidiferrobacter sp. TaxID=1872107 RepID=UPI00260731D7|nr:metalloregulator ArsR/SmtB family transcription factor [Acidiferrobacter sp.]
MVTEDALFPVLSHEIRRRLLGLLGAFGELCVCDLTAALDLPQAVVSRHLAVMREAGLVVARRRGTWVYYRRHPHLAPWAVAVIMALRKGPGGSISALDARRLKVMRKDGTAPCEADHGSCGRQARRPSLSRRL